MRKITALAAAPALIAGLTACGSTAVENTATSTPTRTVTYKIDGEWLYEYSPGVYRPSNELCRTSTRQCDPNFPGGGLGHVRRLARTGAAQ